MRPTPSVDLSGYAGIALLDTGATTSGITPRVAQSLNLAPHGKRPIGSAQGEGQAERYLFRIGMMPDIDANSPPQFPFVFDDLVGFELTNTFQFDALIGMDVLSPCDLRMTRSRICTLIF